MLIKNVNDIEFRKYGKVLKNYDIKELLEKMRETPLPSPPADPTLGSPVQHGVTGTLVQRRLGKADSHSDEEKVWDEGGGEACTLAPQPVNRAGSLGLWSQAVCAPRGRVDIL